MQDYLNDKEQWFDWRNAGPQLERTGRALDALRSTIPNCKPGTWAHTHWSQQEEVLTKKWQAQLALHDTGLKQTIVKRVEDDLDYNWWERAEETPDFLGFSAIENWVGDHIGRVFGNASLGARLNESWERAVEYRNHKIRQGLL